jgi:hypothetical protein
LLPHEKFFLSTATALLPHEKILFTTATASLPHEKLATAATLMFNFFGSSHRSLGAIT